MKKDKTIVMLGGDARTVWAATELEQMGAVVRRVGVPNSEDDDPGPLEAISGSEILVLPMMPWKNGPLTVNGVEITPKEVMERAEKGAVILAGQLPETVERDFGEAGLRCVNMLEQETFLRDNAAITAEGAIYTAMGAMERKLAGANTLVIGYGRIGRCLAKGLKALDAAVTVSSRREENHAELSNQGMKTDWTGIYEKGLKNYDLIFNTVPSCVLNQVQVAMTKPDCLIIELASAPGGLEEAAKTRRKVIHAGGLPGKYAPISAGQALAKGIWGCLFGERRLLE